MKNVITISGDPGSGKSTVRNALKEEFEKEYFNSVKEYKCMSKAILAAIVSLVLGVLAEASVGVRWNMAGIGCMVSVVIMGAFIIYFNDKKK